MKKLNKEDIKKMKEKGKKWFEKNKNAIIFGAGCASGVAAFMILGNKSIKKTGIKIGPLINEDGSWDDELGIMTYGIDRFGNEIEGFKTKFNSADIVWLKDTIDTVEKIIINHNSK